MTTARKPLAIAPEPPVSRASPPCVRPPQRSALVLLLCILAGLIAWSGAAQADDANPLRPADTSSPRAVLHDFLATLDHVESHLAGLISAYAASGRLYLSSEERQEQRQVLTNAPKIVRFFDVSQISPVLRDTVSIERVLQLDEVLQRIKLPPLDDIPDAAAVAQTGIKRWRLPDTEIDFVLVPNGPRAGEWLVSPETVERLPDFYQRVRDLPYKPGPARDLAEAYRKLSGDPTSTIYDAFTSSPAGLRFVPLRWMLGLPPSIKAHIFGVAVWQWIGFTITFLAGMLVLFAVYRLWRRLDRGRDEDLGPGCHALLVPLMIMFLAGLFGPVVNKILRLGGDPLVVITFAETIAFFLAAAWASLTGTAVVAEKIVASERLRPHSMDSQLIRLGMRFVGIVAAIALLMEAASELGFPAFSVLAGLGVGGLAVALAARDSLANLLGSVLIMFEKPFRVGHRIRLGGSEGTVEDVGFRSTRIRTADNSLLSIPNNTIVNATVENLSLRPMLRQNLMVQVTHDTSAEKIQELCRGIEHILAESAAVNQANFVVRLVDIGGGFNIVVRFHLIVEGSEELKEREAIVLQIVQLARRLGVDFAAS